MKKSLPDFEAYQIDRRGQAIMTTGFRTYVVDPLAVVAT